MSFGYIDPPHAGPQPFKSGGEFMKENLVKSTGLANRLPATRHTLRRRGPKLYSTTVQWSGVYARNARPPKKLAALVIVPTSLAKSLFRKLFTRDSPFEVSSRLRGAPPALSYLPLTSLLLHLIGKLEARGEKLRDHSQPLRVQTQHSLRRNIPWPEGIQSLQVLVPDHLNR